MTPEEVVAVAKASTMTHDEIVVIARTSAKLAVEELLLTLGVDATDSRQVLEMQKDFAYLRSWRESINIVRTRGLATAVAVIVTGAIGLLWVVFRGH